MLCGYILPLTSKVAFMSVCHCDTLYVVTDRELHQMARNLSPEVQFQQKSFWNTVQK